MGRIKKAVLESQIEEIITFLVVISFLCLFLNIFFCVRILDKNA